MRIMSPWWLLACCLMVFGLGTLTVSAQTKTSASGNDFGFIGIPDYTSSETGIPFFYQNDAQLVDSAFQKMRDAASKCDRNAYEAALDSLRAQVSFYQSESPTLVTAEQRLTYEKSQRDMAALGDAILKRPPFPANCGSQISIPAVTTLLTAGGFFAGAVVGDVGSVDMTPGPGAFLLSNPAFGGSVNPIVPVVGARAQVRGFLWYNGLFVTFGEVGVQSAFGAQTFNQGFCCQNTVPQGGGSNTITENFQVPILVGVSTPIVSAGAVTPTPIFLDVVGGMTLDSWTHTLSGREASIPNGIGFFGQNNRFTVDPTVGVGVHTLFNRLLVGVRAEVQFRPGSAVAAQSNNFKQTYYGSTTPQTNFTFAAHFGLGF
jgi:hypothetical protein